MKALLRSMWVLALVLTVLMACSQKSGNEQQATATSQEDAQQVTAEPVQSETEPAQVQSEPRIEQQAVQAQPGEQMATSVSDEKSVLEGGSTEQAQEEVTGAQHDTAKTEEIRGTVVHTDDGIALFSDSGSYMIAGQELADMVGKNVKVTGTIDEGAEKPVITVISVLLVE